MHNIDCLTGRSNIAEFGEVDYGAPKCTKITFLMLSLLLQKYLSLLLYTVSLSSYLLNWTSDLLYQTSNLDIRFTKINGNLLFTKSDIRFTTSYLLKLIILILQTPISVTPKSYRQPRDRDRDRDI